MTYTNDKQLRFFQEALGEWFAYANELVEGDMDLLSDAFIYAGMMGSTNVPKYAVAVLRNKFKDGKQHWTYPEWDIGAQVRDSRKAVTA